MIKIENVHKAFGGNAVLRGVSLAVPKGELFALIGGSGGGKSILLKHVAGLLKPDQGRIFLDGNNMSALSGKKLLALRNQLGFVFQGGALFDSMTISENLAFPLREKTSLGEEAILRRVATELENVGLRGAEQKYPSQVSGGMIKRAALARALITDPEIMLFDEPTTGLDPVIGSSILKLIDSSHKRLSFTGIIVTHQIPRVFGIVDKVAMLRDGVTHFVGTPQEFMTAKDAYVQEFVQGTVDEDPSWRAK
jgi:phospholipid/cholesterol/gamma-HCH transport system ATP-binding protein